MAADHMPMETWESGQRTPLCTNCEEQHGACHFCRQSREQQQADDASVQRSLQRLARLREVGQMSVSLDPPPVLCKGKGMDKGCGKGKDKGEGTGIEKKIR